MKKLIQSIFTVAFALATAMTFSSCEDVPAPYSIPDDPSSPDTPSTEVEATGSGTQTDPYNVAAAVKYIENGGSEETEVYVKGIVVSVKSGSYDSSYGSLKYYISDDGTAANQFYVYNGYYGPNRTKFSGEDALKAGDVVVICGKLVEYSGTKEFTTGNYLVELNGKSTTGSDPEPETPTTDAKGTGTQADPYNCAAAINYIKTLAADTNSDNDVYIKGKVVEITENYGASTYGNATYYIADDANGTNKFYVFRSLYKDNAKYSSGDILSVGDDVVVCGKVVYYKGNTPETVTNKSYLYSHTKNGGTTDPGTGDTGDTSTPNGDFETWVSSKPNNWATTSTAGNATLEQSSDAHGGKYSVKVTGSTSANKRLGYKELELKAGSYVVKFYAKAATSTGASVRPGIVPIADGKAGSYQYGDYVNNITNSSWVEVEQTLTITADGTYCFVIMNAKNPGGDVLIDDVTVTLNGTAIIK